jgi:hypothetical protein
VGDRRQLRAGPGVKLAAGPMMFNAGGPTNAVSGNSWAFLLAKDLRLWSRIDEGN